MKIKFLLGMLFSVLFAAQVYSKNINLATDDTQTGVKYRLYHKISAASTYVKDCVATDTNNCHNVGTSKTFTWLNAGVGKHYFILTAFAPDPDDPTKELESGYSNEVISVVTPEIPPLKFLSQSASVNGNNVKIRSKTSLPSMVLLSYGPTGSTTRRVQWINLKPSTSQQATLTGLLSHTQYSYRLSAWNKGTISDTVSSIFITR